LTIVQHDAGCSASSSPNRGHPQRAKARTRKADLLLVLPFIALFLVQVAHHQPWVDELNVWAMALASPNLKQLFHLIHYEAHPTLWYLLVWAVSRTTADPAAMKAMQAAIGTGIYLFLALKSPFSRLEKVLLYLSYFISFEYTVVSRMYGLLLLLTLVYAYKRVTSPGRIFTLAAILALMANTDMMGILFSSALGIEYLVYQWTRGPEFGGQFRRVAGATSLYVAAVAVSILTLRPAKDISYYNAGRMFLYARKPSHLVHAALNIFVLPWFPVSLRFPHSFWEPTVGTHGLVYPLLLPFMAALLYIAFRKDRDGLLIIAITAANLIVFEHLIYLGYIRHHGVAFLAFLVALWIQRCRHSRISGGAFALLALSAAGGILAGVGQWLHPFSNATAMADYIRAHHLEREPLIGTDRIGTAAVAEEMGRPIYFLDCRCNETFAQYDNRSDRYSWTDIPNRLEQAMDATTGGRAIFVANGPLSPEQVHQLERRGIEVSPLRMFAAAEAPYDATALYQVTRLRSAGG
jgi:hypothetical protein